MANGPIVLKFGGTSVQDAAAISNLVQVVQSRSGPRLVIVSALSKVTDQLLALGSLCEAGDPGLVTKLIDEIEIRHLHVAQELSLSTEQMLPLTKNFSNLKSMAVALATLREVSPRSRDSLAAFGELCSSILVHAAFVHQSISAEWIDSRQLVCTNSDFTSAAINMARTQERVDQSLAPKLRGNQILVGQGFIGADDQGATTTLGRGGSDYSAAIYGALLAASRVEIWTDVDGILSTDPRLVPEATTIRRIHFLEAAELAYFGAKVLHPATIFPAVNKKIPVWVLNSKKPSDAGTEITFSPDARSTGICGIAFKKNVTLVNVYSTRMLGAHGFLKSVFDIFAKHQVSVDLIATSEVNISLTLDPNFNAIALKEVCATLSEFSDVEIHHDRAMVSVVGGGIRKTPGLAARIFTELADINVQLISMGASELNIGFVVDGHQLGDSVRRLHGALIQNKSSLV